jgi:hypothetical protein
MSFTLAHIWSGVRTRLIDPDAAEPAAITIEANNALNEFRGRVRQSREDWLDTVERTDILADKDVYDYPANVDTLKLIERLDLAGDGGVYPSQTSSYHAQYERADALTSRLYVADGLVLLPERQVRLAPIPTADMKDGLRWSYLPHMTPLAAPTDVPVGVPEQFFEWLIVGTIDRMRQFRGVELHDPAAYEAFRREQTARLERELRPKELIQPNRIIDDDEFS